MRIALIALLLGLARLAGAADGLDGKVMAGYQGWFRAPEDGTKSGWRHYAQGRTFEPGTCSIDLWPDVRELDPKDRVATPFRHPDGSVAEVYSSHSPGVIGTHFAWMRDYGIDGIFLQRFAVDARDQRMRKSMNEILASVSQATRQGKQCWSLMYDLTGVKPAQMKGVMDDWKELDELYHLRNRSENPNYLRHRGKPLVALWGLGFSDREPMLDEWLQLVRFFANDANLGGCSVMVGVPAYWRTLDRDSIKDPRLHEILAEVDVISPWMVGRYGSPKQAEAHAVKTAAADVAWCKEKKIDYLPVAFPGFSWHNLLARRGKAAPLDAIPRRGGEFFWSQVRAFHWAGAKALYVAMFDELDEGTAVYKVRQDPPSTPETPFVAEPNVPGDHYLWLTGEAGRVFRGELVPTEALPVRPAPGPKVSK